MAQQSDRPNDVEAELSRPARLVATLPVMPERSSVVYEPLGGERHRHAGVKHAHPHTGPHTHDHADTHAHDNEPAHGHGHAGHGHSHGLVHDSIKRSREGVRAVARSLAVLGTAALVQTLVFVLSGSVALLADLIHNFGDALTAVPLGIAFVMRSERAERQPASP
jgi:Co/Zn/Cd efflux system component